MDAMLAPDELPPLSILGFPTKKLKLAVAGPRSNKSRRRPKLGVSQPAARPPAPSASTDGAQHSTIQILI
jgi:hypothetical protein